MQVLMNHEESQSLLMPRRRDCQDLTPVQITLQPRPAPQQKPHQILPAANESRSANFTSHENGYSTAPLNGSAIDENLEASCESYSSCSEEANDYIISVGLRTKTGNLKGYTLAIRGDSIILERTGSSK